MSGSSYGRVTVSQKRFVEQLVLACLAGMLLVVALTAGFAGLMPAVMSQCLVAAAVLILVWVLWTAVRGGS